MEIKTSNLILKKEISDLIGTYYIYETISNKLIGTLTYRGYHYNEKLGDIGYLIHQSYTNKGYGKEALFKIIELLNEHEIPDFWITCDIKNDISKHIITEYLDIETIRELNDIVKYKCSTNLKLKVARRNNSKKE